MQKILKKPQISSLMPFSFLQHLIVRQTLVALNIPTNYIFWYFPACFETVIVYRDDVDLSNYATSFFLETPGNASSSKWNISKVHLSIWNLIVILNFFIENRSLSADLPDWCSVQLFYVWLWRLPSEKVPWKHSWE